MRDYKNYKILLASDIEGNIDVLSEVLSDYDIIPNIGKDSIVEAIKEIKPDLVLLEILPLGTIDPELCSLLKSNEDIREIPIILISSIENSHEEEIKGFERGAIDYIPRPLNDEVLRKRVRIHLEHKHLIERLKSKILKYKLDLEEKTQELEQTQEAIILCMAAIALKKGNETELHLLRTQKYARLIMEHLRTSLEFSGYLNDYTIQQIYKSVPLHDIGNILLPGHIINNPGRLSDRDFTEIKKHTEYGKEIISVGTRKLGESSFFRIAEDIIYTHHEKWDGTGYPRGLMREEIPIPGRIMAIADVYDVLTSKKVYKTSASHEDAIEYLYNNRGEHFDPYIVDAFIYNRDIIKQISNDFKDV